MEATNYNGEGLLVIADDDVAEWPKRVLAKAQQFAIGSGFFVQKMMPKMHSYHLDDSPDLRSCNLMFKALPANQPPGPSTRITDVARLKNFYGRDAAPRVRYVREKERLEYGKRHDDEFSLEMMLE
jgi:hypothetical protein